MRNAICGMILTVLVATLLSGCSAPLNSYEPVFDRFYSTTLKLSTSSDVLAIIQNPETETVSQSDSVVAAWGVDGKKDRTHWFNMVAFDEEQMNAVRKYGFMLEETNFVRNSESKPALRFDAHYVMDEEVLDAPYANNNEKQIEILKAAYGFFSRDSQELVNDSKSFRNSTIMVKQALNTIMLELNQTPAFAAKLPLLEGMGFDHPRLDESYIRMLIEGDIVKIKIKCSEKWFKDQPFEEHPDVNYM